MLVQPWDYIRHQIKVMWDKTESSRLVVSCANTGKGEGERGVPTFIIGELEDKVLDPSLRKIWLQVIPLSLTHK